MSTCQPTRESGSSSDPDAVRRHVPVSAAGPIPDANTSTFVARLATEVARNPRLGDLIRRITHPEAERIIIKRYDPPQGPSVLRAVPRDDMAACVREARWGSRFCRENPGTRTLTAGEALIRSELASAAWEGKQERLGAAIAQRLEAAGIPRTQDAYLRATKDMALNDLIQVVPLYLP